LFYPDTRESFDEFEGPYIPDSDVPPIWNPEFFANTMVALCAGEPDPGTGLGGQPSAADRRLTGQLVPAAGKPAPLRRTP
jgi:hypothetical protein